METKEPKKRGRKPLPLEVREANRRATRSQWENVSLKLDAREDLKALGDALEAKLGFRPSHSQTVRHAVAAALAALKE